MKRTGIAIFAITAVGLLLHTGEGFARGAVEGPVIYVESQGLFYDSIVTAMELPPEGPFQQLYACEFFELCTEFGPGDLDYYGGRWWMDNNENGEMDDDDVYFSCPLLGPGREAR